MTESSHIPNSSTAQSGNHVAPLLPPTAEPPEPLRKRFFLSDLLLYWILPHSRGPHLAVRSIWRALAAHALAIVILLVILHFRSIPREIHRVTGDSMPDLHDLRVYLAEIIWHAACPRYGATSSWQTALFWVGGLPLLEIAVLLIGTLVMPFAAGGDPVWSVWKRSVKNAYWSTILLLPALAMGTVTYRLVYDYGRIRINTVTVILAFLTCVLLFLWARALLFGAGRYVGKPNGPAWLPREPLCDDCGYTLIHLPLDSRCPECGLPVADSLPDGRRKPLHLELNRHLLRSFLLLVKWQWNILRKPAFFKQTAVQNHLGTSRYFWWITCLIITLGLCVIGSMATWACTFVAMFEMDVSVGQAVQSMSKTIVASALMTLVPIFLMTIITFPTCLWAQARLGIHDYRVSATACFYSAPLLWPFCLAMLLLIKVVLHYFPNFHRLGYFMQSATFWPTLAIWGCILLVLIAFLFWLRRLAHALRDVRFANV